VSTEAPCLIGVGYNKPATNFRRDYFSGAEAVRLPRTSKFTESKTRRVPSTRASVCLPLCGVQKSMSQPCARMTNYESTSRKGLELCRGSKHLTRFLRSGDHIAVMSGKAHCWNFGDCRTHAHENESPGPCGGRQSRKRQRPERVLKTNRIIMGLR
jgi:hypothetical protein